MLLSETCLTNDATRTSAMAKKKKKWRKERGNKQEWQENMRGFIQLHISQRNVSIRRGITEVLALFVSYLQRLEQHILIIILIFIELKSG